MTNYHDHRDDYLSLQANVICLLLFGFRRGNNLSASGVVSIAGRPLQQAACPVVGAPEHVAQEAEPEPNEKEK
jgi:hypothetical protein